jgi:hypothetical protein
MQINDTLLMFWKSDARCFLCYPDTKMASNNTQRRAVSDCLTKHNLADVCDLIVLISVDSLWRYEYGSDLDIFSALAIFPTSTLDKTIAYIVLDKPLRKLWRISSLPVVFMGLSVSIFKYYKCYIGIIQSTVKTDT